MTSEALPAPREEGTWTEEEYLALQERTNRLVDFVDGHVEVLDRPTKSHQLILHYLSGLLGRLCRQGAGELVVAAYPVRIRARRYRTPDVVFMLAANHDRLGEHYADGADLVMEVISQDRERDLVRKHRDYAEAGIPEYWIVDPRDRRVLVLRLEQGEYHVHGEFGDKDRATSVLLAGFEVDVGELFAAGGI